METVKPTCLVCASDLLAEIQEEIKNYVLTEDEFQPTPAQPGDRMIGDVSENEELKKVFALKNRYFDKYRKQGQYYAIFHSMPPGVGEKEFVETEERMRVYDWLFFALLRRAVNHFGVGIAVIEGWKVAAVEERAIKSQLRGEMPELPEGMVN